MKRVIVYTSNTGHTKMYADMLGEKLNLDVYDLKEAKGKVNKDTEVIYLGWVSASMIKGLKKAMKSFNVILVGAVGMMEKSNDYTKFMDINKIDLPFFYLRGGVNYDKLKGLKKTLLQMVGRAFEKNCKPEEKETLELFKNGGSFVSEKNLEEMIDFINKKNTL